MSKTRSAFRALMMTRWFILTSIRYVVTKRWQSKVEFLTGVFPAWVRFTVATYGDFRAERSGG